MYGLNVPRSLRSIGRALFDDCTESSLPRDVMRLTLPRENDVRLAPKGRSMRERVRLFAGQCRLIQRGYRQGGPVGFGLRRMLIDSEGRQKGILEKGQTKWLQTDRVVLVPGPEEEQKIVQEIYLSFVEESKNRTEIANSLNARGIPSRHRRPWSFHLIHEILVNPKYIGANVYNRTSVRLNQRVVDNAEQLWVRRDGCFPPIVSSDLFLRAAKIIESRKHRSSHADRLFRLCQENARESACRASFVPQSFRTA